MKYKINKDNEIEKSDFTITFKKEDYPNSVRDIEKKLKELKAQLSVYQAEADNVSRNHKEVLSYTEDERNVIWLYQEKHIAVEQSKEYIKKLEKGLKEVKKEMEDIEKQTNIKFYE